MKILQFCKKIPFPFKDGEAIAISQLTKGLYEVGAQVHVLAINTPKHCFDINDFPDGLLLAANYTSVFVNTQVKPWAAFKNLFTTQSYNIERFYSEAVIEKLISLLQQQQFDIIQLEGVYLARYISIIRQYSNAKIVLRAHNIESEIWERLATECPSNKIFKKLYLQLLAKRMASFEKQAIDLVDAIVPISDKDAAQFKNWGYNGPLHLATASVNLVDYPKKSLSTTPPDLFFIGSLDWLPNLHGLNWFYNKVWPSIHSKHRSLQCFIAGRNAAKNYAEGLPQNVIYLGEIPDAQAYMQEHSIMIVPLFSGSGMRVKLIEGMALGKCIVCTALAAEGIAYTHQQDILIANTKKDFIQTILGLLEQPSIVKTIGANARATIKTKYDTVTIAKDLLKFYSTL